METCSTIGLNTISATSISMILHAPSLSSLSRSYAPWMWFLLSLFIFRILAQLAALLFNLNFLPPFESWHGGILPYPLLLATQFLILYWLVKTASQFSRGAVSARRDLGVNVLVIASIYFVVMLARLVLGMTILSEHRWFASPLPAFFHLVLASFLLLYGHFHFRHDHKGVS